MTGDSRPELEALGTRVAALEAALHDAQRLLLSCALTALASGLVARRLGREQEALIRAAGLSPEITAGLEVLERHLARLEATISEVLGHVR
jgi:hypothetical protein